MMANEEHVRILKQGVEIWNAWRRTRIGLRPDLRGAELQEMILIAADLRHADLTAADCSEASLSNANLSGAKLNAAIFTSADLTSANLAVADALNADFSGASFWFAHMEETVLQGAVLRNSDLRHAILIQAELAEADFSGSKFAGTVLSGLDLSRVKGLHSTIHTSRSTLGFDTILRSGGRIPASFLRGIGLPDELISYTRSLLTNPVQFYSCFISYSGKDDPFAKRLNSTLQDNDVRCWFAPEDMKIGDPIRVRIDESIQLHDKLLLVLSDHSLASTWVADEVEAALEKEREQGKIVLFPITLDDAIWDSNAAWAAKVRRERHIGDFRCWKDHDAYQTAVERLLRDLKAEGG